MRTIKLTISFDGTDYSGWQRQSNARTIQGDLEDKLSLMTAENIVIHGAGRTDAGVHALAMTAHFTTSSSLECYAFRRGLNSLLDYSVKILHAEDVDHTFHARISARAKEYHYFFSTEDVMPPCRRLYCAHLPLGFDLQRTRKCLSYLIGEHDFTSFEASGSRDREKENGRGAVRRIFSASLDYIEDPYPEYHFKICGDGFLRKMVRNIAGTLVEVGQHRMGNDYFNRLIAMKDRSHAGPTAPACGLFLKQVYYGMEFL